MNIRHILVVFFKELSDTLRDRRTWTAMVIVPLLLMPLLIIIGPTMIEKQVKQAATKPSKIGLVNEGSENSLVKFLMDSEQLNVIFPDRPEEALMKGEILAVVYIGEGIDSSMAQGGSGQVRITFDASSQKSTMALSKVQELINGFSQDIVAQRLEKLGVNTELLHPLIVQAENAAPKEKVGGSFLGLIIPMLLAVWAALGGMYAAIDAAAGEKERGTLEPLLAAPVSRLSLVTGKYLTVVLTSVVAAAISLLGIYLALKIKPGALMGKEASDAVSFALPLNTALLMALISLTLAAIFSALELAVSIFARSFKEAQTYLSPLSFIVVLPGIFTQFVSPADVPAYFFSIPMLNAIMVFKELLLGTVNWGHITTTLIWSAFYVILTLRLAVYMFNRETVLFRM
ncbi:MAG: ABC transporter permease subunit [Bacillota bacterium]